MARPIRVEFAGAVYHVTARGNERRRIFRDGQDRRRFLETLAEAVAQFGLRVHAYCLMPNHYHLLVETPRGNASQALGWLQLTYTVRFNRRHRRSGHLFQGRYKAVLVEADEYARWLVVYVHLNPVRPVDRRAVIAADRAADLDGYVWSSHRDYAGRRRAAQWLCLDWLRYWGRTLGEAQAGYRGDVARAFGNPAREVWAGLRGGVVLGGEALWEQVRQRVQRKRGLEEAQWSTRERAGQVRERVREAVASESDRRVVIWARVRVGGERAVDVGREQGYRDGAGVAQLIKRLETAAARDRSLRTKLMKLSGLREE